MGDIKDKICIICYVGYLIDHPEKPEIYLKCPLCGYTKEKPKKKLPPE